MERPSDDDTDALLRELIPGLDDEEWGDSEALRTGDATLELQAVSSLAGTPLGDLQPDAPADVPVDQVADPAAEVIAESPADLPQVQRGTVVQPPSAFAEARPEAPAYTPQPVPQEPYVQAPPPQDAAARTASMGGRAPVDEPPRWITAEPEPQHQPHLQPQRQAGGWIEQDSWYDEPAPVERRTAERSSGGGGRLTGLLLGLGLALLLGGGAAAFVWFQSNSDDGDTAATADEVTDTEPDGADALADGADGGADGSSGAGEPDAEAGADNPVSPGDAGLDPVTGEAYPGFLDLLSLPEFSEKRYPHGLLSADGTVTFRGRVGTQDEIDTAIADMEAIVGPGNVISEFELTPGFPSYTTGLIFLDQTILFETNSTDIDPSYEPFLDNLILTLAQFPDMRITAVGHADSVGTIESNIKISRERAQAVFTYLVDRGVSAVQVSTEARGETGGTDDEDLEEASANDRRVEFVVDFGS